MERPNVLLTIPNLGKGGAQQVFRDQFIFFSQHANATGSVFNWDDSFPEDQLPGILSLDVPAGKNALSKIYFFVKRISRLRKIKEDFKIDISISHLEGADYINIFSRHAEKVILWIHGTKKFDDDIKGTLGWLRKKVMIPMLYRRANLIITVSEGIRSELIREFNLPAAKIRTISNSISLRNIATLAASEEVSALFDTIGPGLILITHCRLARQKNLDAMLRIIVRVKERLTAKLIIVGDGELRVQLIEQSRALNLVTYSCWEERPMNEFDQVLFLGYRRNPYQYLSRATLYMMTSSWEGFPLSICEAMACKLPVLASDCFTGPREILSPEIQSVTPVTQPHFSRCGVLMPLADSPLNIKVWADTICEVLNKAELRANMARGAVERATDFDQENIEKYWLELLLNTEGNQ